MPIQIGQQLGSLEITALLGKGGMGQVYRARDTNLKRFERVNLGRGFSAFCAVALLLILACPSHATTLADIAHMRAIHMTGNWGGNIQGIKASQFASAPTIAAASVHGTSSRSSFTDKSGNTITNDILNVTLTSVAVGGTSLSKAGFWVGRNAVTSVGFLQFRPSLDPDLAGIPGFSGDITISLSSDGSSVDTSQLAAVNGVALSLVQAVIVNGWRLMSSTNVLVTSPSLLDSNASSLILHKMSALAVESYLPYFQFLKSLNVDWIGISVAMFIHDMSDPTVRVLYSQDGAACQPFNNICTFADSDLISFITAAKQAGFRVYLTLAFEGAASYGGAANLNDGTCGTPTYTGLNRSLFGKPLVGANDSLAVCVNPSYWWWSPSSPNYTTNVAAFWNSYTEIAVKYAAISQQTGVDLFSLGTETDALFRTQSTSTWQNNFMPQLTQMVESVRAAYGGLISYDQGFWELTNPNQYGGITQPVFSDLGLDVVGVSAYFPLTSSPTTAVLSVSQLEQLWEQVFSRYLVPLQAANLSKPIVFLEFGYTDDVGSPFNPTINASTAEPALTDNAVSDGMQQQVNVYQAFFNVNATHDDLVAGAFIWGNHIFTGYPAQCTQVGLNAYCKPLAQTIADIYAGKLLAAGEPAASGWWWSASESGRAYGLEFSNGNVAMAAYMYRPDGTPVWYYGQGPYSGTGTSIALVEYTGHETLSSGPPVNAVPSGTVGNVTLSFTTPSHGTITWTGASFPTPVSTDIVHYAISGGSVIANGSNLQPRAGWPATGLWWSPIEGGTAYFIESQGTQLFLAAYLYSSDLRSTWYYGYSTISPASTADPDLIAAATLFQASNGQTLTSGPRLNIVSTPTGSFSLEVLSGTASVLTLPNGRQVQLQKYSF